MEGMNNATNSRRNLLSSDVNLLKDSLLGLTAVNQNLVLLEYGHVVVRRDYKYLNTVRLISGGNAGSYLNHATLVGKGMLTAAILGDESAPNSRLILRTIKELSESEFNCGVFVIAQVNSELFNFGLATERANADCHLRVKLLSIDDDNSSNKERNSCGVILLTKILGAMAENGALYDDILHCYNNVVQYIVTVPLCYLDEETGPQRRKSVRLTTDFDADVRHIIDTKSQSNLKLHPSIPTVALINITKSMEKVDEFSLVKQVIDRLRELGVCIIRIYLGNFVSSICGSASLTVLRVYDPKIIEYLDAPCLALGWQQITQFLPEVTLRNEIPSILIKQGKQHIPLKGPKLNEAQKRILTTSVQFACDALISCENQLNVMDAEASMGNIGTRLKRMGEHVNKRINNKKLPPHCPYAFLKKLSVIAETSIGGTMGSIYGILFESAANIFEKLPEDEVVTPITWANALTVVTDAVKQYCSPEMECKTMYYPLKSCELAANKELSKGRNFIECFGLGVSVAEESAQQTGSRKSKYADAGAHAVGIWMRAVFEGVKLMHVYSNEQST